MAKVKTRAAAKTPAAKKAAGNGGQKRADSRKQDRALVSQIKELRSGDKPATHAQIAKKLGIQQTKALFLDIVSQVSKAKQIRNLTPAQVKSLRGEGLAWHTISARTFAAGDDHYVTTGKVKAMYKEATGKAASGRVASSAKKGSKRGR